MIQIHPFWWGIYSNIRYRANLIWECFYGDGTNTSCSKKNQGTTPSCAIFQWRAWFIILSWDGSWGTEFSDKAKMSLQSDDFGWSSIGWCNINLRKWAQKIHQLLRVHSWNIWITWQIVDRLHRRCTVVFKVGCVYVYIYIYVGVGVYIRIYIYIYVYVYIYICVHTRVWHNVISRV